MSLADEENVQPLLSTQDVETGEPVEEEEREAPPHADPGPPPVSPPPLPEAEPEE